MRRIKGHEIPMIPKMETFGISSRIELFGTLTYFELIARGKWNVKTQQFLKIV